MISKHLICPNRVRRTPGQFSWVDHRLVRERYIDRCGHGALALYLFLVTVSDAKGLSYYSDRSVMGRLSMDRRALDEAREALIRADLIAYQRPLYQVLGLDRVKTPRRRPERPVSLEDIFKQAGGVS
ncbi:conserved hypothetical protein [Candidatus Desulfarcum epimagneticum]|uniref:Uncharacterized protein n=1 Tax=uncultured Desulfobacteraceae bacterium TaxID=218296 RepID=A0A484HFX5_9BACT|nr:conserved hypothetical protein [uncultured Desulfobacteraceae bacterium]